MRLTSSYSWVVNPTQHTIADAVDRACMPSFDSDGVAERAAEHASKTSEMLGRLIERLHEKKLFDNEDVLKVIGHGWKAVPEAPVREED